MTDKKTGEHHTVPGKPHTISELAKEFGVTTRTIRFYEEKGLVSPIREGQKRLFTNADRVRIKLILRGKRIGMTLQECVEFIDMYDPEHNNAEQLQSLIDNVKSRREQLLQQKRDIDEMLEGLKEVQGLCEASLAGEKPTNPSTHKPDND
jgi:DNA-binding transcriptional MerR regulator